MVQNNSYSEVVKISTAWEKEKQDALLTVAEGHISEEVALTLMKVASRNPIVDIVNEALVQARKPNPNPTALQKKSLEEAALKIVHVIKNSGSTTVYSVYREKAGREVLQALSKTPLVKEPRVTPKPKPSSKKEATLTKTTPTPLTVAMKVKKLTAKV